MDSEKGKTKWENVKTDHLYKNWKQIFDDLEIAPSGGKSIALVKKEFCKRYEIKTKNTHPDEVKGNSIYVVGASDDYDDEFENIDTLPIIMYRLLKYIQGIEKNQCIVTKNQMMQRLGIVNDSYRGYVYEHGFHSKSISIPINNITDFWQTADRNIKADIVRAIKKLHDINAFTAFEILACLITHSNGKTEVRVATEEEKLLYSEARVVALEALNNLRRKKYGEIKNFFDIIRYGLLEQYGELVTDYINNNLEDQTQPKADFYYMAWQIIKNMKTQSFKLPDYKKENNDIKYIVMVKQAKNYINRHNKEIEKIAIKSIGSRNPAINTVRISEDYLQLGVLILDSVIN